MRKEERAKKNRKKEEEKQNIPPQLYQDSLHGVIALPLSQAREHLRVDDAVAGVDGGEVDLADELDGRGLVGVVVSAVHLDAVDAVLVNRLAIPHVLASCCISILLNLENLRWG